MDQDPAVRFRRRRPDELAAVYRLFRRSLFDYLGRTGQVDAETAASPPIDDAWARQQAWMEHLAATAAEDWVAEAADGRLIGWAQSTERDGLFELTLFFVDPAAQAKGVGRGLLERAFPAGRGSTRVIIATQDPPAVRLYLGSGVRFVATTVELGGRPVPAPAPVATDLSIERVGPAGEAAALVEAEAAILGLERELLGHERVEDVRFLLRTRPTWLARRDGRVVGMAFGAAGVGTGPIAALEQGDLPALLLTVENEAAERGLEEIVFTVPLLNTSAVDHLLARRFRIDPFYVLILCSDDRLRLDRWVHTTPDFIL